MLDQEFLVYRSVVLKNSFEVVYQSDFSMHRGRGGVRLVSMYESLLISFKQHKHICLDEISREKRGLIWEDVHTNTICVKPLCCRLETRRAQSDVLSYAQSLKVTFHQKIMQCICGTWLDVKVKLTKLKWSATFQILMLFIIFFLKQSHPDSYFSVGTLFEKIIIIFNSNRILHKKRKLCNLSYSCCSKTTWWLSSTKLFFLWRISILKACQPQWPGIF